MVKTTEETDDQNKGTIQQEKWKKRNLDSSDEMVTLTKSQLRAILEAIGQIGQQRDIHSQEIDDDNDDNNFQQNNIDHNTNSRYNGDSTNCPAHNVVSNHSCSDFTVHNSEKDYSHMSIVSQPSTSSRPFPMSRLDQKRLQWERERAEMQEWNPWGKPGAGAPRYRNSLSHGLSKTESQVFVVHSASNSSYPTPSRSSLSSPYHMYKSSSDTPQGSQSPNLTTVSQSLMKTFRNSLPFSNNIDELERRKEHWIHDIERERGEQRHLIEEDKQILSRSLNISSMDDQKITNEHTSIDPFVDNHINSNEGRIFLRGQGLNINPDDVAIVQERRQKALDYQREVKQQIEEKRQKEKEEKERKLLEEQEEEKRLAEERALMQKEYEEEQRRQKEKEEQEERKRKVLIAAMEEAQASAEAAKKASKAQRTQKQKSNPETHQRNSEKESISNNNNYNDEKNITENEEGKNTKLHQQKSTVYSVQNNNSVCSYSEKFREFSVQTTDISESYEYTENRILTPTVVRMREKAKNKNREFGTQTDFSYINQWIVDDGDSALSTSSSLLSIAPLRKNRIQHNKPTKASQKSYEYLQNHVKWGVSPQQKPFVKMSERDPHYPKRKKLLELRRQHWEREMANQRTLTETRSIFPHSYNKHSRNAKLTSSDGSLSSSETEEKYHRNSCPVSNTVRKSQHQSYNSADDIVIKTREKEFINGFYSDSHTIPKLQGRLTQSSDNLVSQFSESLPLRSYSRNYGFLDGRPHHPSMRKKWHSQETFLPQSPSLVHQSVPALQKRYGLKYSSNDSYHAPRRKWSDQESYKLENMKSSSTKYNSLVNGIDNSGVNVFKPDVDPLVHPEIVTRRPTPRQDKILMQLSSLRQGLLIKQQELEDLLLHPTYDTS